MRSIVDWLRKIYPAIVGMMALTALVVAIIGVVDANVYYNWLAKQDNAIVDRVELYNNRDITSDQAIYNRIYHLEEVDGKIYNRITLYNDRLQEADSAVYNRIESYNSTDTWGEIYKGAAVAVYCGRQAYPARISFTFLEEAGKVKLSTRVHAASTNNPFPSGCSFQDGANILWSTELPQLH